MRWWGWGDPAHAPLLTPSALSFLADTVGVAARPRPPVALGEVRLPRSTLSEQSLVAMRAMVGAYNVRDDHFERVVHAAGKGYPDLVRLRAGDPQGAPDAVVMPRGHEELRGVLELCERMSVAVVPFGGGTSVVGGLAPLRGEHRSVIALDTRHMDRLLGLDRDSLTVAVQAGMRAPALERQLAPRGLTLGHFPQSFQYVSLGGCAATRSAGQASSGYGSIEKMILGLRLIAPRGDLELPAVPATAAGPGLRQLLVGSEGAFGVIGELSLRVRPAPRERFYDGYFFTDFAAGVEGLRSLSQQHALPEVARLSDEQETRTSLALAGSGGVKGTVGRAYLGARGYGRGCLAVLGFEGAPGEAAARRKRALALLRDGGALSVGRSPAHAWLRSRFSGPYLRDELLTQGVMVETLETATQWSNVTRLHRQVGEAISSSLSACGTPALVMCHVSHLYESGASLYFTFLALQRAYDAIGQWQAVKDAASRAITAGGGTITHHHGIGRDHARWLGPEVGRTGKGALRAVKSELDPANIMNPGKLLA